MFIFYLGVVLFIGKRIGKVIVFVVCYKRCRICDVVKI